MNPIVNPIYFYLANVGDKIQIIAASVITPDNINLAQDNIVDFINNIAKALHNAQY